MRGAVPNPPGKLEHCPEELGVVRCVPAVAGSGRVGIPKPDPRLFQHALSCPGLVSNPAWMVGDNFEADIRPAAALGLSTAWLAPETEKPRERGIPTVRLKTLSDLAGVLES